MMLNHCFQFICLVTRIKASRIHDNPIWRVRSFDRTTFTHNPNTFSTPECSHSRAQNNLSMHISPFECTCRGFRHPISWCVQNDSQSGPFPAIRYEVPRNPPLCHSRDQNYFLKIRTDYLLQRNQNRMARDTASYQNNYALLESDPNLQKEIILNDDQEDYKNKIITWFKKQKKLRNSAVKDEVLEKIAEIVCENFDNDMKNGAFFAGYVCFLTQVFIGFKDKECLSRPDLLKVSESQLAFGLKEIKEAISQWKSHRFNFNTIKEGCDMLYTVQLYVDPKFYSYSSSKLFISLKIAIIYCLKHFFGQETE
ncbi:hypothetical protein TUBRATIS_006740 [Tubulinosema ratisbonensis]|uniref:Uncharacterized protein n=1 Tax=Tubulinosema ratisbonensis TaxID=291195 RepID=A0A437ANQ2_9MICR|nr:hypothetical protein TUBRATIS_006740 [Tubulinosema ratisbonensis]